MGITLGRYTLVTSKVRRKGIRKITAEEQRQIESSLDRLAEILSINIKWVLSGGLAVATTLNTFYRGHDDLDIDVYAADVEQVAEEGRQRGYDIFSRETMVKITPTKKGEIYRRMTPQEIVKEGKKKVRLVRINERKRIALQGGLLDYIDVYINYGEDGSNVLSGGATYTTQSGRMIHIIPLEYLSFIKQRDGENGEKARIDMEMMTRKKEHVPLVELVR